MLSRAVNRLVDGQRWLDPVAEVLQKLTRGFYKLLGGPGKALQDFLHGTWLGHPLHPLTTDIPLGIWSLAVLFDIVYLFHPRHWIAQAATAAVAVGVITGLGVAVSGLTDWSSTYGRERRVGVAHGLLNAVVILLFAVSWMIRGTLVIGAPTILLDLISYALLIAAGYLGGDLVFAMGTAVNHHAWQQPPTKWTPVLKETELPEGKLQRVLVKATPILVYKRGATICTLSETCSHAGGPLSEGTVEGNTVVCPWHGSRFDICTGEVKGGPATASAVGYEARVENGQMEIRRSAETFAPR